MALFRAQRSVERVPVEQPIPSVAQPMIMLSHVTKTYHSGASVCAALRDVSLEVPQGTFSAIIGKSGSGKSTLLNMITGIDRPSSGSVLVHGTPVHALNERQSAAWRGRSIGIVFQFFQLLPALSALENVMLPMDFCQRYPRRERPERALHMLELVGMAEQQHRLPNALSGGQQQRVAIARALANDPAVLVADEPTGNLDSATADAVFALFDRLVAQGKTLVMVTHDPELAGRVDTAITVADGVISSVIGGRRPRAAGRGNV